MSRKLKVLITLGLAAIIFSLISGVVLLRKKSADILPARETFMSDAPPSNFWGSLSVSPNASAVAFIYPLAGKYGVVVNGTTDKTYPKVFMPILFSPDGNHILYLVQGQRAIHAIYDGKDIGGFDNILIGKLLPSFSVNSSRYGFFAQIGGKYCAVIDGKAQKLYPGVGTTSPVTFSADGKSFAYVAKDANGKAFLVVNGQEKKKYDNVGFICFVPHSNKIIYCARIGTKSGIINDGVADLRYDDVYQPYFSPDGLRLVYVAKKGKKYFLVCDGIAADNTYDFVSDPFFSPDGKHVAYVASNKQAKKGCMVIDGKEGRWLDGITANRILYSPDSKHTAYFGRVGKKWYLVLDGKMHPTDIKTAVIGIGPYFSPDSRHIAYVAPTIGNGRCMVVDDKRGPSYAWIIPGPDGIKFESAAILRYVAIRREQIATPLVTEHRIYKVQQSVPKSSFVQ